MAETQTPQVVLYYRTSHPQCNQARDLLVRREVEFAAYDVSQDQAALREMIRLTGQRQVPVIAAGRHYVIGFNRSRLDELFPRAQRGQVKLGVSVATAKASRNRPMGAYVGRVQQDSPADRAGIRKGDIVLELAQRPVRTQEDVHIITSTLVPGTTTPVTLWRTGYTLRLTLAV
jgi:S1-C subfamily serine protease